jgi:hypothetical protein
MARTNRSNLIALAFTLGIVMALPFTAAAQSAYQGVWLASASPAQAQETAWGRMTLKNGMLEFSAPNLTWQSPLTDITRIVERKGANRQFTIETASGDAIHVAILGLQMMPESPRKAMQAILRAVRETPGAQATVVAAAAGGGSF